ncbi:DUF6121 family protein [Curtobacterium sp. RRHDQ10]|uniref:DUF6121 family protein n=1 Tax=Curtobacterium phyllosphaerae TaxID=3413379 RepID=UPI003BF222C4
MSRWLLATMTTVLFVALVIAVTGIESLMSATEVISQSDATPYLGPAMVTAVAIVVFCATAFGAQRGSPVGSGLVGAATAYLVMLGVGSLGYTLVRGDVAQLVVFPAAYALGPFVVGTVVIALVVVVGAIAVGRHEHRRAGASRGGQ